MHSLTTKNLSCNYFEKCDLIQKYRLKSLFQEPKVRSVFLEVPLYTIDKSLSDNRRDKKISFTLLLFFFLFGSLPRIVYQKTALKQSKKIYSFKHSLKDKRMINDFLVQFLINTVNNSDLKKLNILKKEDFFMKHRSFNSLCFTLSGSIPLTSLLMEDNFFFINNTQLNLNTSFLFKGLKNISYPNKLVKNIFPL
jgi:hypothetical protein